MKIEITFRDSDARRIEYHLRILYNSKAKLERLAKVAILDAAAKGAKKDLEKTK